MSDLVQLTKNNDIAIITINNPPVNALSPGVPEGIAEAIEKIDKDPGVKAAVLIGSGTTFIAGADIKEFGKITSGQNQRGLTLVPILQRIEVQAESSLHWKLWLGVELPTFTELERRSFRVAVGDAMKGE